MKHLETIMALTKGPHNLRPALVGPTGAGKTARVRQAAESLSLPVHTMLLSHVLPEEISGIPHVTRAQVSWPAPEWAKKLAKQPHVLFLDEFDKARRDVTGAVLTLLWELKVGDTNLHPDTILVLGMQPTPPDAFLADETGRAIAARCIWLPVSYDWKWLESRLGIDLTEFPPGPSPELPILPEPSPRQVEQLYHLVTALPPSRDDEPALTIARGVLPAPLVEPFLDAVRNPQPSTPEDYVEAIATGLIDPADPTQLPLPMALTIYPQAGVLLSTEQFAPLLIRVYDEAHQDDVRRAQKALYEYAREHNSGELCRPSRPQDTAAMIANVTVYLSRRWSNLPERTPPRWTDPDWMFSDEALEGLRSQGD